MVRAYPAGGKVHSGAVAVGYSVIDAPSVIIGASAAVSVFAELRQVVWELDNNAAIQG
ncbi:MAG: hypothetical protein QM597_06020 [Aeromicrobium sp.]|uniref:hypothetical protein n=1 Tax=Aeromicrobium sp. TaxID=1871063 RepID=UPI0039E45280